MQDKDAGERKAAQENDCEFLSSGANVIPIKLIAEFEKIAKEPIEKASNEESL
jgi:hypothetical protein